MARLNLDQSLFRPMQLALVVAVFICCAGRVCERAGAQDEKGAGKKQRNGARAKVLPGVTPEREAAVLMFVRQHHPELIRLLGYLRDSEPRQYQRAVRELARTVERLAQIHERDIERHDLELRAWKARSHIDVLIAQWRMEPNDQLLAKLRSALVEQAKVRKEYLEYERARLVDRLKKLDTQIEQADVAQRQDVEAHLRALINSQRRAESGKSRNAKDRAQSKPGKNPVEDQCP